MSDAQPLTDGEVAAWRRRFPTVERCTYLINNSLGAMPATVPDALATFAAQWRDKGVEAWSADWLPLVRQTAGLLEGLLSAPAGSVVVHQNVATLTAMVLSTLDFAASRNRIVLADVDWPSHHYLAHQQRRLGADVRVVPTNGRALDPDDFRAAVDERTVIVLVSHVLFRDSATVDVASIVSLAHQAGALCLVDGYHAVGHMPVDVAALDCDFYVGGSVKWLCGGPGVGYLYVRPELLGTLQPRDVGWLGHVVPFDFSTEWAPADGAMGWLGGTPAIPALFSAAEGYRAITEVSPASVRATSLRLTQRLIDGALERGIKVRTPTAPARRAGAVTLHLGDDTERISRQLIAAGVLVDFRPGSGIRVGPHFFNTLEECDVLLDHLDPT